MPSGTSLRSHTARVAVTSSWVVIVAAALTSCAGSVAVAPPAPTSPTAAADCAKLHGRIPSTVVGAARVLTTPRSELTAAWGDPAITFQCGVGRAAGLAPDSELITVNGVDWLPEQHSGGYLFTSVGRAVNIAMSVPHKYAPETSALADVSTAISQEIPRSKIDAGSSVGRASEASRDLPDFRW